MIAPLLSLSCVLLVIVLLPWQEQGMRIVIASNAGNVNDSSNPKAKTLKPNPQAPKNLKHQTKAETVDPIEPAAIKPEFLNPITTGKCLRSLWVNTDVLRSSFGLEGLGFMLHSLDLELGT